VDSAGHPAAPSIAPDLVRRLHRRAGAARWSLAEADFAAALSRSAAHRFRGQSPASPEVARYLESLHLEDLALACACARGNDAAWEHFVRDLRPALLSAAASCAPPGDAHDLADSIYADLFGVEERDGVRRSLFDYFHGRSTLAGWLRAVLAQRVVDRVRETRRFEPLPDDESAMPAAAREHAPDPDRERHLPMVRAALAAALAGLLPRDRLRLALYYTKQMKLAAVGRVLGESEATVSRKLDRTRHDIRRALERRLREENGLNDAQVAACYEYGRSDAAFDLARALPPDLDRAT
jgi:RNA polymerase sigma-70 factor (ECF subfamily)